MIRQVIEQDIVEQKIKEKDIEFFLEKNPETKLLLDPSKRRFGPFYMNSFYIDASLLKYFRPKTKEEAIIYTYASYFKAIDNINNYVENAAKLLTKFIIVSPTAFTFYSKRTQSKDRDVPILFTSTKGSLSFIFGTVVLIESINEILRNYEPNKEVIETYIEAFQKLKSVKISRHSHVDDLIPAANRLLRKLTMETFNGCEYYFSVAKRDLQLTLTTIIKPEKDLRSYIETLLETNTELREKITTYLKNLKVTPDIIVENFPQPKTNLVRPRISIDLDITNNYCSEIIENTLKLMNFLENDTLKVIDEIVRLKIEELKLKRT